jgi:hypothetical protein
LKEDLIKVQAQYDQKVVLYSGYANSGGTIIGLIFQEIYPAIVLPMEFRLLKERFGVCDLEDALFRTMDPEIIDLSLRDFEWLCRQYAGNLGRFNRAGYGYEKRSGGVFLEATKKYVNSIVDHTYSKSWHFYDFQLSYPKLIIQRVMRKILRDKRYGEVPAYIAYPKKEHFLSETKVYLKTIFDGFLREQAATQSKIINEESFVVLPKSIPLYKQDNMHQIARYFDDPKMIIIDRDPRDIFLDMVRGKRRYLPSDSDPEKIALAFVKYYRMIRQEQSLIEKNNNVLLIKFEEMINDYERSIANLYEFTGIDERDHYLKGRFFNPNVSKKNTGMWEACSDSEARAISVIASELGD